MQNTNGLPLYVNVACGNIAVLITTNFFEFLYPHIIQIEMNQQDKGFSLHLPTLFALGIIFIGKDIKITG
jgi:hypothetical protein